ncbi:hypothetical protein MCAP1_001437 [Malassezia caprae]|uniref:Uncharacterized protein n=1 Tax=Malassezia caprae TaxID=1381934 RepID=A0AAF0E6L6_9BASI|nr:hypothetical protein MCAP1_001437 [Malassezia caprae]
MSEPTSSWCQALELGYVTEDDTWDSICVRYSTASTHASMTGYFDTMRSCDALVALCRQLDIQWGRWHMRHMPLEQLAACRVMLCPPVHTMRPVYPRNDLWHMELDHADRCLVVSVSDGSLRTLDAASGALLWSTTLSSLPPPYGYTPFFQYSDGWLCVYHYDTHRLQVWRSERTMPWLPEPQRGVYRLHTQLPLDRQVRGTPVSALHYPILSYMPDATTLVDMNVDTLQTDRYQVDTPGRKGRVHTLDSMAQWVALSCGTAPSLLIAQRDDALTVCWRLEEHLGTYGAPEYYVPMPSAPTSCPGFQWRPLVRTQAPRGWLTSWIAPERRQRAGWRPWQAIQLDPATDTLVALSRRGLLVIWPVQESLRAGRPPRLCAIATSVPPSRTEHVPLEDWLFAPDEVGHMHMHQGRVVAMYRTLHLLDLRTPTWGQAHDGTSIETPFTLYMWSRTPFEGCSQRHEWQWTPLYHCVQMDHTSIFVVTREALTEAEHGAQHRTVVAHLRLDTAPPPVVEL